MIFLKHSFLKLFSLILFIPFHLSIHTLRRKFHQHVIFWFYHNYFIICVYVTCWRQLWCQVFSYTFLSPAKYCTHSKLTERCMSPFTKFCSNSWHKKFFRCHCCVVGCRWWLFGRIRGVRSR